MEVSYKMSTRKIGILAMKANRAHALFSVFMMTVVFVINFVATSVVSSSAFAAPSAAKEVKFKDYPIEISKGDRLVISGIRGSVKLIQIAPGKSPVVRAKKVLPAGAKSSGSQLFENLSFQVRKEGTIVTVEAKGPASRQEFIDAAASGQPELSFEIEAPSTPAEVHFHSGQVTAVGWKDGLSISLIDGKINSTDGEGILRTILTRGEIKIDKQKGNVEIENHGGKVALSNIAGDVRLYSFSGDASLTAVSGKVRFRAKAGSLNLNKLTGDFTFENGRGGISGTAIDGAVRGSTEDGAVNLQLAGDADLSVETEDGSVTVKAPGGSGALLKLSSEDGPILAPESVRVPKVSGPKSVVARLDGAPKGQIIVRSKRGVIRIR
jgi:hypothetical protein